MPNILKSWTRQNKIKFLSRGYVVKRKKKNEGLLCEAIRERLTAVRLNLGLTRAEVSRRSGVTPDTLRQLEQGRTLPGVDTAERIAVALDLDPRWFVYGRGRETVARTMIATAGYDPIQMCSELSAALSVHNGVLHHSYKYLDPAGAVQWTQLLTDQGFSAVIEAVPLASLVEKLALALNGQPYDFWALGAGTAQTELSLMARLLAKKQREAQVFLVDVSQPLLTAALLNVERILPKKYPVPVTGFLGDFNHFASIGLLPGVGRRRILTMFGYTLSNLDNEVRFLRRSLSWVEKDDILVLDVPMAVGQTDEAIQKKDPALSHRRAGQWSDLLDQFLTGPIRRHLPEVKSISVTAQLDRRSSVVPGSYAVEHVAVVKLADAQVRRYSIGYSKRYELEGFTQLMKQEGWSTLFTMEYGPGFLLCAFQRDVSPRLQGRGRPARQADHE
jgi:transcriptional regulator with XRE-family HTH domain